MNIKKLRDDFPLFKTSIDAKPLIYLDNASTTQKPQVVLDALMHFYTKQNANVHRGIYQLAEQATQAYEQARATVAHFIKASPHEIVFTKSTTEGINAIAGSWGQQNIEKNDEIIITELEHHSNFVPWQQLALQKGAHVRVVQIKPDGTLNMDQLTAVINKKTKLIAVTHESNVLGTKVDVETFVRAARSVDAKILIDAAQTIAHQAIDVKILDPDFLVFSGHKVLAPTGIGCLYIKESLHNSIRPYQFGGGMLFEVCDTYETIFLKAPHKFEAGTPPIAQAIGLASAIDYLQKNVPFNLLQQHESKLTRELIDELSKIKKVRLLGPLDQLTQDGHMLSFYVEGIHAHDVAAYIAQQGICVRAGHHCAQPLAKKLGIDASVRVSFYLYNTHEEVERLVHTIKQLCK